MNYQHVLLVTDLLPDADAVAKRAKYIVDNDPDIKLSVLHIVENDMSRFGYNLVPMPSLSGGDEDEYGQKARAKLAQFIERNKLRAVNSEVTVAVSGGKGIVNYCREKKVDLLIIGRHERHGIAAWLIGATADNILPNISCDSLVVKLDQSATK